VDTNPGITIHDIDLGTLRQKNFKNRIGPHRTLFLSLELASRTLIPSTILRTMESKSLPVSWALIIGVSNRIFVSVKMELASKSENAISPLPFFGWIVSSRYFPSS
jgi:hypothetical protein